MDLLYFCCFSIISLALLPGAAWGEPTLELQVMGRDEVLAGDPESASVNAQGVIGLGPTMTQVAKIPNAPVTTILSTDRGLFAGTAGDGIYRIEGGQARRVWTSEKLVVSAMAANEGKLYAASGPDGQILSLAADGSWKPFFDPSEKYVWSMIPDAAGLVVATGEPGRVVEVGAGGTSRVLFAPEETHVRALIRHPTRGIIAGGGQKGVVYQLRADGAFALYDSGMEEVTAFAVDPRSGDLFAAFVSETKAGAVLVDKTIGPVAGDPGETGSPIKGSEVVRIAATGRVDVLFSSRREGALALAFDAAKRQLYIATGASAKARGRVYAIDLADRDRLLLWARIEAPIATALVLGQAGRGILVGTAPSGEVLELGPGLRAESTYLTSEQDLERPAKVGRIWFDGDQPEGTKLSIAIRSGNTKLVDPTWSGWSPPIEASAGGAVSIPEGRYVQLRARLSAGPGGKVPGLKSLHASVLRRNVSPEVQEVFLLRPGVYLRPLPQEEEREKTITVSPTAIQRLRKAEDDGQEVRVRQGSVQGTLTVAWRVEDKNRDELLFRVELRRVDTDGSWVRLADDLAQTFHSFDARAFPDGRYQLRVTASDRPSNAPSDALSDANVSGTFVIDNTAPVLRSLVARPINRGIEVVVEAEDVASPLGKAEFSINGGPWLLLPSADGLTDATKERFQTQVTSGDRPGEAKLAGDRLSVAVRVEDQGGNATSGATTVRMSSASR